MPQPIVHFEVIGKNPAKLRSFYSGLFDWEFDTDSPFAPAISDADDYLFVTAPTTADGRDIGIPGGVGGGENFTPHTIVYVGVPNVEAALLAAESRGATRVLGPQRNPSGELVIGQFRNPEGNLVGLAGPQ